MLRRLLLISNSTNFGRGYLDHCESEIQQILGVVARVLFIPYALRDWNAYTTTARQRLGRMGYQVDGIHEAADPCNAVGETEAVFVGGGNTFRLLDYLYKFRLLDTIRNRVDTGMPYVGSSAGSNVACPTIKTTNDMPIVQPPSFIALGLVPFNINPHYVDSNPESTHMGETRESRIREFHEENDATVVGLREGGMLRICGPSLLLKGIGEARVFVKGREPQECSPGSELRGLLTEGLCDCMEPVA